MIRVQRLTRDRAGEAARLLAAAFGRGNYERGVDRVLALGQDGCLALIEGERLVGMVAAIDYGTAVYLGMMAVAPDRQGRGHGRRLMEAAMAEVPAGRPMLLDATPEGRRLYERLGFVPVDRIGEFRRAAGMPVSPPASGGRAVRDRDGLQAVLDVDAAIFGCDRGAALSRLLKVEQARAWVLDGAKGMPAGYALLQADGAIGPIVASDRETACRLLATALAAAPPDSPAVLRTPMGDRTWVGRLESLGFGHERDLTHMRAGGSGHPSRRAGIFALANFHLG